MTDQQIRTLPPPGTRMTTDEFLALPETTVRMELINGVVVYPQGYPGDDEMTPSPHVRHQMTVAAAFRVIDRLNAGQTLFAPMDVTLPDGTTVQPDAIWIAEGSTTAQLQATVTGVPDLLVEVLSPSTQRHDKVDKFRLYESAGVREYWIIDPMAAFVEVWQFRDGAYAQVGRSIPGETFASPALGATISVDDLLPWQA